MRIRIVIFVLLVYSNFKLLHKKTQAAQEEEGFR